MFSSAGTAPLNRPSVLFVCTANRIRSPLAAALFRQILLRESRTLPRWRINSAGTWVQKGEPPPAEVIRVGTLKGLDLTNHRAQEVNEGLLSSHNLILVMEHGHKESIQHVFPNLAERIYLLSEMNGENREIKDPASMAQAELEFLIEDLSRLLEAGLTRIVFLAHNKK
ncbi:MAG: hypothetical protein AB1522_15900 [Chloroflexota bacterium]